MCMSFWQSATCPSPHRKERQCLDIEVMAARADERDVLANMIQLYTHDFSEQWSGTPRGDLQDDGRFPAYPLDVILARGRPRPLLFRLGGSLDRLCAPEWLSRIAVSRSSATWPSSSSLGNTAGAVLEPPPRRRSSADTQVCGRSPWPGETSARLRSGVTRSTTHPLAEDVEETDFTSCAWNGPILRIPY